MKPIETNIPGFTLRFADETDAPLVLRYIKALAENERELDQVSATEETLRENLFRGRQAEVLVGEWNGAPVGFALFHSSFSTYIGKAGLHLVDLYVEPHTRGKGFGKTILSFLAGLAKERGCGRLEWWVHAYNSAAIRHYANWGGAPVPDIQVYRLSGQKLDALAAHCNPIKPAGQPEE